MNGHQDEKISHFINVSPFLKGHTKELKVLDR